MKFSFKTPELSDRQSVCDIIADSDCRFCEFTFGNIYCWGGFYGTQIAVSDGLLVTGDPTKGSYSYPKGRGDKKSAVEALIDTDGFARLYSLSEADKDELNALFPDRFDITERERAFDYVYESEKLRLLSGKKLAAKRNHINAFLSDGSWEVKEITPADRDLLLRFNKRWCKNYCGCVDSSLKSEMCATECGINNFEALGYRGLMLYKNGVLVAYSLGEPINADTFCVHVEKADQSVRGAYQMINREFARMFCEDYAYINREDDAGDEGLRRAKLSYYPTDIGKKYVAKLRGEGI